MRLRDHRQGIQKMDRTSTGVDLWFRGVNLRFSGMNLKLSMAVLTLLILCAHVPAATAQDEDEGGLEAVEENTTKRAQTGFKFLRTSVSARAAAMGDAMTAMEAGAAAMFYNPATMAYLTGFANAEVGITQFFADINYNAASVAVSPAQGRYGVFGLSFINVDYGDLEGTIRVDNEKGYEDYGLFSPNALMVGVGYAKSLSDRFAVGGNIKYAIQDLGEALAVVGNGSSGVWQGNKESAVAFDIGVLYDTGFKSLKFAMTARNFSREVTFHEENFELPLLLTIGLSMDMTDLLAADQTMHSLVLAVDAYRPRDFYEAINFGAEYSFMEILNIRAGYIFPTDEQGISLGAGINTGLSGIALGADYAYTNFGLLGDVHRISMQFGF